MINSTLLLFLFTGFSSEALLQIPSPNLLLIMADDLPTDLESNGMKVVSLYLAEINQSQLRFKF